MLQEIYYKDVDLDNMKFGRVVSLPNQVLRLDSKQLKGSQELSCVASNSSLALFLTVKTLGGEGYFIHVKHECKSYWWNGEIIIKNNDIRTQ